MASQMPKMAITPITLAFHLSCWQNRRARIYLDGLSLDQFPDSLDVNGFAKHLVLISPPVPPLPLDDLNGRPTLYFHYDEPSANMLELQVWHSESGRRCLFEEFGSRLESDPTMRLERLSTAKNRFYITLDCDKRLKVQRLVLVAILRINGQLFVSEDAHFPPPSSKRNGSPRLKGRTGPYETLLSFSDVLGDEEMRASPKGSPRPIASPGRRRASSLKSTSSAASSPRSVSSTDVTSWQALAKWILESRHNNIPSAVLLQHLMQLATIAIDFGKYANGSASPSSLINNPLGGTSSAGNAGPNSAAHGAAASRTPHTLDSVREELIEWLQTGPYHIMELLEGGILQQCVTEPWFLGNISDAGAQAYLAWYCQRMNLSSAFLVKMSASGKANPKSLVSINPHFVIEALWTNEQTGVQERYTAPVVFEMDMQGNLYFWIETANDSAPSRSSSLAEVAKYIVNTTGWHHVWRNPPAVLSFQQQQQQHHTLHHPAGFNALAAGSPTSAAATQQPQQFALDSALTKHRSMPHLHSPTRLSISSASAITTTSSPLNLNPGQSQATPTSQIQISSSGTIPKQTSRGSLSASSGGGGATTSSFFIKPDPSAVPHAPHVPMHDSHSISSDSSYHDDVTVPYNGWSPQQGVSQQVQPLTPFQSGSSSSMQPDAMETDRSSDSAVVEDSIYRPYNADAENLADPEAMMQYEDSYGGVATSHGSGSTYSSAFSSQGMQSMQEPYQYHHHAVQNYSDAIGGARSLSAPTALRAPSLSVGAWGSSHMVPFHHPASNSNSFAPGTQQSGSSNNTAPSGPYYMTGQGQYHTYNVPAFQQNQPQQLPPQQAASPMNVSVTSASPLPGQSAYNYSDPSYMRSAAQTAPGNFNAAYNHDWSTQRNPMRVHSMTIQPQSLAQDMAQ